MLETKPETKRNLRLYELLMLLFLVLYAILVIYFNVKYPNSQAEDLAMAEMDIPSETIENISEANAPETGENISVNGSLPIEPPPP